MASLLSPGVISREIDLTTATPAVASTEGGIALDSKWGPAEKLVLVTDEVDLVDIFGKPDDSNAARWFTAKNFLSYSGALYVSRAIDPDAALNSTNSAAGILIKNSDDFEKGKSGCNWAAKYSGSLGNSLRVELRDSSTYSSDKTSPNYWNYSSSFPEAPQLDELHIIVIDEGGLFSGVKGTILEKFEFLSKFGDAKNEDGTSNYYKKVINDTSEYVWAVEAYTLMTGWGGNELDYVTFSDSGVASLATGVDSNDISLQQSITLGEYTATLNEKKVTELTLDDTDSDLAGTNFTVGSTIEIVDENSADTGVTATVLSWASPTLTLENVSGGTILANQQVHNVDHQKITIVSVDDTVDKPFAAGDFTAAEVVSQGSVSATVVSWNHTTGVLQLTSEGNLTEDGTIKGFSIESLNVTTTPQTEPIPSSHSLDHGSDGSISDADIEKAYDLFVDEELVDISFLIAGPDANNSKAVALKVYDIASSRQDCIGVISPQKQHVVNSPDPYGDVKAYRESLSIGGLKDLKGSFMVMDDNWKYQFDKYNNVNRWVPCNGDTAGLMAETDLERAAWFSPGGRGLKNVIKLAWKSKKAERDVLYPLGINSVTTFPGEGAILYGDRTMLRRPSAFDRINVRRLFIVLRKTISRTARSFLFENNTSYTRERFKSTIIPFLEEVQGRQGITDFLVVCDESNNTGQVIDQNRFIGDIYIKPTRSINFIELNFVAVRTDVEFSEVVGSV